MKRFYIADMHFGHENIIGYDNRPFINSKSMDDYMIYRWNMAVGKGDEVYILGDMFWKQNQKEMQDILNKLNGMKHLILGNHDPKMNSETKNKFNSISHIKEIKDGGHNLFMCHYPVHAWNRNWYDNSIHLNGHVHVTSEYSDTVEVDKMVKELNPNKKGAMINVGVMMPWMYYTPRTLDEILSSTQ